MLTRRLASRQPSLSVARGFTLVELLIVIAVIGALTALIIPAAQSAREAARRTSCSSQLKQLGVALALHHNQQRRYPFGGWGFQWVGVPGRKCNQNQPGSWAYCILPLVERNDVHELGRDNDAAGFSQRIETAIPLFVCPSRRTTGLGPAVVSHIRSPKPTGSPALVARGDYAINAGVSNIMGFPGPANLAEGDQPEYWSNVVQSSNDRLGHFTGVSHLRSAASLNEIVDGASRTYLIGEKHLSVDDYDTGASVGDNESLYSGYCTDLHRFSGNLNAGPGGAMVAPLADSSLPNDGLPGYLRFGSAHPAAFGMVYCDGSVRWRDYQMDPLLHLQQGHRADGGAPLEALVAARASTASTVAVPAGR